LDKKIRSRSLSPLSQRKRAAPITEAALTLVLTDVGFILLLALQQLFEGLL
jgi:hypothetical protein